jgi:hypothetical protein
MILPRWLSFPKVNEDGVWPRADERAYAAIRRWMIVRGYRLAGPKRELNLGQMLEIQFPLMEM